MKKEFNFTEKNADLIPHFVADKMIKEMEKENNPVIEGMIKACMMKEALASCQIEGIGEDITLEDLYLEELKTRGRKK